MTADDYRTDQILEKRHACAKPVRLLEVSAKGKSQNRKLAEQLVSEALQLAAIEQPAGDKPCTRVAVIVNRVACAKEAYRLLRAKHGDRVHLMIGRMRPVDRDRLTAELQKVFRSNPARTAGDLEQPHFVVATQCLEVGADFDFDGLVSQCASLSALRQRFGRLNRMGQSPQSRGVIAMAAGDIKPKKADPIYGDSLPETWGWLPGIATDVNGQPVIDMGIKAMDATVAKQSDMGRLTAESANAPVLLPAHLDLLCQTAPRPAVEPDISMFLHGPNGGQSEVRVCWRADLPEQRQDLDSDREWAAEIRRVVGVCPPSAAEMLSIPLTRFRNWLIGDDSPDDTGDLLSERADERDPSSHPDTQIPPERKGIVWTGQTDRDVLVCASTVLSIRPNDTIVLPVEAGGWSELGHVPERHSEVGQADDTGGTEETDRAHRRYLATFDVATDAFRQSRNRTILRVHRGLVTSLAGELRLRPLLPWTNHQVAGAASEILTAAISQEPERESPNSDGDGLSSDNSPAQVLLKHCRSSGGRAVKVLRYPGGIALVGPMENSESNFRRSLPRAGFGDDFEETNVDAPQRLSLASHLADVAEETRRLTEAVHLESKESAALVAAAERHDLGKADPRFQAMLLGASVDMAHMQPCLWAKSSSGPSVAQLAGETFCHSLPKGFRHEMLSLQLAERLECDLEDSQRDLMLHAVAAHHGHARPFAPVVDDDLPADVSLARLNPGAQDWIRLSGKERRQLVAPHQFDSGIAERFWKLNRRFGWWGLAWLESTLRLADWQASADPANNQQSSVMLRQRAVKQPQFHELPCPGLDATNPLGFLSAMGMFRSLTSILPDHNVRMKWQNSGIWHPVLTTSTPITAEEVVEALQSELHGKETAPQFTEIGSDTTVPRDMFRDVIREALDQASASNRTTIDFFAAFGSDGLVSINDRVTIQDTALRTMAGAGHQHFLDTMRNIIEACEIEHLRKAVFQSWKYDDPTQTLSLRFDPIDDNRYALRWRNPSGDPERRKSGSMLGANRLAIEAIPLLTTAPGPRHLQTIGFKGHRSRDTFFSWPVWTKAIDIDTARSVLALSDLQSDALQPGTLPSIASVFRSQRITVGKVRNFTHATMAESAGSR